MLGCVEDNWLVYFDVFVGGEILWFGDVVSVVVMCMVLYFLIVVFVGDVFQLCCICVGDVFD